MEEIYLKRKLLSEVRQKLSAQSEDKPFSLSDTMSTGETVSEFVVSVALKIHKKRTKKPKD